VAANGQRTENYVVEGAPRITLEGWKEGRTEIYGGFVQLLIHCLRITRTEIYVLLLPRSFGGPEGAHRDLRYPHLLKHFRQSLFFL
jgi:hypothetical protein